METAHKQTNVRLFRNAAVIPSFCVFYAPRLLFIKHFNFLIHPFFSAGVFNIAMEPKAERVWADGWFVSLYLYIFRVFIWELVL